MKEARLSTLGIPADIIQIALHHRDLPVKARERVLTAMREDEKHLIALETRRDNFNLPLYLLEAYVEDREKTKQRIEAYRTLFSVVRSLPVETMGEIFLAYLALIPPEGIQRREADPRGKPWPSPGIICQVCYHWNVIAKSTPALWSNIRIEAKQQPPGGLPRVKPSHVRGIMTWMDRVASHPWSLSIAGYGELSDEASSENWGVPLLQLLQRRPSLYLQRMGILADRLAVGMGGMTFPRVTSLVLSCDTWKENRSPTYPDLPSLPSLTQAFLDTIPRTYIPTEIPWSQLTHLHLGGETSIRQWRAIFKLCTSLQRGCFQIDFVSAEDEGISFHEPEVATFPFLTELAFLHVSPFNEPIGGLSMPCLTKLQLFSHWSAPTWDFAHSDLFSNLTHLTLIGHWQADLIPILRTLPLLTELFFHIEDDIPGMFDFLTFTQSKHNLRYLEALGMYMKTYAYRPLTHEHEHPPTSGEEAPLPEGPFPYLALTDLVASRTRAIQRGEISSALYKLVELKHLVLRVHNAWWLDEMLPQLKEAASPFVPQGLKVTVGGIDQDSRLPEFDGRGGDFPDPHSISLRHWDEGCMDFIDSLDEYSLYPKDDRDQHL